MSNLIQGIEIFPLLECYATQIDSYRRFGTNYLSHLQGSTEDGTDRLFQNVGNKLPLHATWQHRKAQFSSTSRQKPEVTQVNSWTVPLKTVQDKGAQIPGVWTLYGVPIKTLLLSTELASGYATSAYNCEVAPSFFFLSKMCSALFVSGITESREMKPSVWLASALD